MHNKIYLPEPPFHQLLNVAKLSLDALHQNMRKVLVVVFEKSDCLLPADVDAAHQLFHNVFQKVRVFLAYVTASGKVLYLLRLFYFAIFPVKSSDKMGSIL